MPDILESITEMLIEFSRFQVMGMGILVDVEALLRSRLEMACDLRPLESGEPLSGGLGMGNHRILYAFPVWLTCVQSGRRFFDHISGFLGCRPE